MLHFPYRAGNYILFAELGSGTVGTTYIGREAGQGRTSFVPLVLRILPPHLSERPEIVRVFLDEQRAAALLQHPRIAAVYEVGLLPDGSYFMASEYVHGMPIREVQRMPQAQLMPAQAVHVAMQICDALHYAHERLDVTGRPLRIVHGQLSPDAVLLGFDGNIKVTEFGLLRTRDAATITIPTMLQRRTAFMAPELRAQLPLRSAPNIDRRADVYSIGAILWEMLAGEPLMPRDDDAPPPALSAKRQVDPQLSAIVMRAMARSRDERFPSAQSMRLALTTLAPLLSAESSIATSLARSLTVTFRERMVAFQEQYDLWRKYEDGILPEEGEGRRRTDSGVSSPSGSGPPSGRRPGLSGGLLTHQSHPSLSLPRGVTAPMPGSSVTPLPGHASQGSGSALPRAGQGRLFVVLLGFSLLCILLAGVGLLIRTHSRAAPAVLLVDSQPRGAVIHLDGREVGQTPLRIPSVQAAVTDRPIDGTTTVRVELRKVGYRVYGKNVLPQPGRTVSVEVELEQER